MRIIFIFIIIYLLHIYAAINTTYTKYKLRGIYKKEKNRLVQYMIDAEYKNIYHTILQEAGIGKTNLTFTILCFDEHNPNNIVKTILSDELFRIAQIYKMKIEPYKISSKFINTKIIEKLKITFPQSNIVSNTIFPHIPCSYYTLDW
jgi:hypothetical protein